VGPGMMFDGPGSAEHGDDRKGMFDRHQRIFAPPQAGDFGPDFGKLFDQGKFWHDDLDLQLFRSFSLDSNRKLLAKVIG
jgi:hypothetical protein